jgi:hypothetical protein
MRSLPALFRTKGICLPNPGQPTISLGATGGAGWLANDLDSFGGGATAAPTKPGDAAKPIEATKRR